MDCERGLNLISARLDREISADDRAWLDAHLADCADCRTTAAAFELQHAELREEFAPRRAAAAATAAVVADKLPATAAPMKAAPKDFFATRAGTALVLFVVAVLLAITLIDSFPPKGSQNFISKQPDSNTTSPSTSANPDVPPLTPRPRPPAEPIANLLVGKSIQTPPGQRQRLALPDHSVLYVDQSTSLTLDSDHSLSVRSGGVYVESAPGAAVLLVTTPVRHVTAAGRFAVRALADATDVLVTFGTAHVHNVTTPWDGDVQAGQFLASTSTQPEPAPRASYILDWTRDLMAASETPLVPASRHGGGALLTVDANGQEAKLAMRSFTIDVHIEDGFARTTIDQTYFNQHPWRLEGTFFFPLPADASLSRLCMYVDGTLMEGGMAERDYARSVYQRVVNGQRDPALLEWVDGTTFKMRVFPLEGRQEKRIVLSYIQRLPTLYGRTTYRFPAGHSLQKIDKWHFRATVKDGLQQKLVFRSPTHPNTHAVAAFAPEPGLNADKADPNSLYLYDEARDVKADRDVVLELEDPASAPRDAIARIAVAEQDGHKYLMARYRPQLSGEATRQRRDWVILFEASADRDPLLARTQVDLVRHLLTSANADDTFVLLTANSRVHTFQPEAQPVTSDNVAAAVAWLERTHLVGALDLGSALDAAGESLKKGGNPYLLHIGSGLTSLGVRQPKLLEHLPKGHYIGIGVGKRWSRDWMKQAAEKTGGHFTQVNPDEPIGWRAFELMATLDTPRLLETVVEAESGPSVPFLLEATTVCQGEELCAVARLNGPMPAAIVVRGRVNGEAFRQVVPLHDVQKDKGYLPRTWARLEIERMLANPTHKKEDVIALSKDMYVMTPYTSLLVLENEEMYAEYKVDRGRKDHWAMYDLQAKVPVKAPEYDPSTPADVRNAPKGLKPAPSTVRGTIVLRGNDNPLKNQSQAKRGFLDVDGSITTAEYGESVGLQQPVLLNRNGSMLGRDVNPDSGLTGSIVLKDEFQLGLRLHHHHRPLPGRVNVNNLGGRREDERGGEWEMTGGVRGRNGRSLDELYPLLQGDPSLIQGGIDADVKRIKQYGYEGLEVESMGRIVSGMTRMRNVVTLRSVSVYDIPTALPEPSRPMTYSDEPGIDFPTSGAIRRLTGGESLGDNAPSERDGQLMFTELWDNSQTPGQGIHDVRRFTDLISYAPGLNTSAADIQAVLESEAAPDLTQMPGHIDPAAGALLDKARQGGWQRVRMADGTLLRFDAAGRYTWNRTLPLGLREEVICDGKMLVHLYPDLGLAGRRSVSRFHRMGLLSAMPWLAPPAEDLARGADVLLVGERTIAIVPHRLTDEPADKKAAEFQVQMAFGEDGRLVERRLVAMPGQKALAREVYDGKGGVRLLGASDKPLSTSTVDVQPVDAPNLEPATDNLVVLPMPLRSKNHVWEEIGLDPSQNLADSWCRCLDRDRATLLLSAALAEQNRGTAWQIFNLCFAPHGDQRIGLYVILAACGQTALGDQAEFEYHLTGKTTPLARYLMLATDNSDGWLQLQFAFNAGTRTTTPDSPRRTMLLQMSASLSRSDTFLSRTARLAIDAATPAGDFLHQIATLRDLNSRWSQPANPLTSLWRKEDMRASLAYVLGHRHTAAGRSLLVAMQAHNEHSSAHWRQIADTWGILGQEGDYQARYEQACCLAYAGDRAGAKAHFLALYEDTLAYGFLPPLDQRFRQALEEDEVAKDGWAPLMRATAARFVKGGNRPAAVALAQQVNQLQDRLLADNLLDMALSGELKEKEKAVVYLAAIDYLKTTSQAGRAETLLGELLTAYPKAPALWRMAVDLADNRGQQARAVTCLETALDLEYAHLPEVIALEQWRKDYGRLLGYYREQALILHDSGRAAPGDLAVRTVRAVDRWRAHDPEIVAGSLQTAAATLALLGKQDLAWDYYTTEFAGPIGAERLPNGLANTLANVGAYDLADRVYAVSCAGDPSNGQTAWDRAQNLRQAGRAAEAEALLRKLAEDKAVSASLRDRVRWQLGERPR